MQSNAIFMSKKPIFQPFPKFVLRTPLFPITCADVESDIFREAIFLASPELYEGNKSTNLQKQEKFDESILKYRNRACTRCTPFGLFAGCSVGTVDTETEIELLPATKSKRTTRLDMQYLCALIQEIERIPDIRSQLLFYPNDSIYSIGGVYRYIEYHYKNTQRFHNTISLEIDEPVDKVLEKAKDGATIRELSEMFVDENITYEEAAAYIDEAINRQILKSELEPCVVGDDVLMTLISKLSRFQNIPLLGILKKIQNLLSEIDSKPLGTTLPLYGEIIALIDSLGIKYEAKFLFQTDMFKPVQAARLSSHTATRLDELIQFLAKISVPYENPNLSKFKEAFVARYEDAEMPLAQVMDGELGIGYSSSTPGGNDVNPLVDDLIFPSSMAPWRDVRITVTDQILLQKYAECIRQQATTVLLTDADFKNVGNSHTLPDSLAVMCSLLADDKIYIKSIGGASGANLLGRFCHLDKAIYDVVREAAVFEQQQMPDQIIAEISHLPESRIGNIASRPSFRDFTLHYLSNYEKTGQEISVSDLMLSVRSGRLFLRSKKYDKEVIPRLTCAHNYSLSPLPIYRFLCDMQQQGKTTGLILGWNSIFDGMDYWPRIQYKDMILTRQRWIIRQDDIAKFDRCSADEKQGYLKSLFQAKRITRHVVIPDADNELYLDLEDAKCQQLLLNLVKQRKILILEEFLFDGGNAVVKEKEAAYTNEVIILFHK